MHKLVTDVSNFINKKINNINTIDVGVVQNVNETSHTVDILLMKLYDTTYMGNTTVELDIPSIVLYDVPVMRPLCRNIYIENDIMEEDRVIVGYSKKDLVNQLITDTPLNLNSSQNFSIQNAVVLGTIPKWGYPVPSTEHVENIKLIHSSGSSLEFASDGSVTITASNINFNKLS